MFCDTNVIVSPGPLFIFDRGVLHPSASVLTHKRGHKREIKPKKKKKTDEKSRQVIQLIRLIKAKSQIEATISHLNPRSRHYLRTNPNKKIHTKRNVTPNL
jgi:hypothetical protein